MAEGVIALVDGPFAGERVVADPDAIARRRGLSFAIRGDRRELLASLLAVIDPAADAFGYAQRIGREWRVEHYRTVGVMKLEYVGAFRIAPRMHHGEIVAERCDPIGVGLSIWKQWLAGLDDPAQRFGEVVRLFPSGPLAEYVTDLSADVAERLTEARRLAAVGEAAYPGWLPGDVDPRAEAIVEGIDTVHGGLRRALDALVDLHLAVGRTPEPEIPRLEALVEAWRDLLGS